MGNTVFGLTAAGFIPMQQADVENDLNAALKEAFGANVNLAPISVFGQVVGILSERFALLWQLGEAIYDSQYPSGAEGTSVDNILALNNLTRLPETPTITEADALTNATTLTTEWGLVLFGTAGTVIPAGSIIQTTATPPLSFKLDAAVTIASARNAVQSVFFGNVPNVGAFEISIFDPAGNQLTTPSMPYTILGAVTNLAISTTPASSSNFTLILTQAGVALTTGNISAPGAYPTAAAIQAAIRALSGYSGVTVSGSGGGYLITWGSIANPLLTVGANTTGASITTIDSVQAAFNNIEDTVASPNNYPYTDVVVTGSFASGFVFNFGAGVSIGSNPNSQMQQESLMTIAVNTFQNGSTVTNINVTNTTTGSPAQGIGSATCTTDGPSFVSSGTLSVIGSPVSGWSAVTNQLDCITGTNAEDDTQAIVRRSEELEAQANGPIQAIVEKVAKVSGVTQVKGFVNLWGSALQLITWASVPASGSYYISIGGFTSSSLAYNAIASTIQAALEALPGFTNVLVTGDYTNGFTIDFNGSSGGQGQSIALILTNTTGVVATVAFTRPGNSFEIVAIGGSDADIANAIYSSMPAGIKSYGTTTVEIFDSQGTPVFISFSRAQEVTIYVVISLITDTYVTPGVPSSGNNANAEFSPGSVDTIQSDILAIGNAFPIGGTIIGFGSNGLIGAFNSVPGIVQYTMSFGTSPTPVTNTNVPLLSEQVPLFESFNITVSWI